MCSNVVLYAAMSSYVQQCRAMSKVFQLCRGHREAVNEMDREVEREAKISYLNTFVVLPTGYGKSLSCMVCLYQS